MGRSVVANGDAYMLRESTETYDADFDPKNRAIAQKNCYFWNEFS
jgi:hypothetical protein